MGRFGSIVAAGFFLGPSAAAPMGLALALPPVVALVAVLVGVIASFVVALFLMEWLRRSRVWRWLSRARSNPRPSPRREKAARRARAILLRFGPVGFGLFGPALLGTWVSAVLGSVLGLARWRLLTWLVAGATAWTALLVLAAHSLLGLLG
ncbi:MAG TPA: small multi-drug export protein [Actinophytocola sp.]|nr:small multi-drug export protein [Actinophytocola sp.]